jgi:hypothetical protein
MAQTFVLVASYSMQVVVGGYTRYFGIVSRLGPLETTRQ